MKVISDVEVARVYEAVRSRYANFSRALPFHGWHHVEFVTQKARSLAEKNGADISLVEVAALVHDLNYMVNKNSNAADGTDLRAEILAECSFSPAHANEIDEIVRRASIESRARSERTQRSTSVMTLEMQAVSDADTLYKALPITPVMLSHLYMQETGTTLRELADKILRDQEPLLDAGTYFFDAETRLQYERWALTNVNLWRAIRESLGQPEVQVLVDILEGTAPAGGLGLD